MSSSISIVIRTYGPERLSEILEAILAQEADNYSINEIVVVNGDATYCWPNNIYTEPYKIIFITNSHMPYRPGQALNTGIRHTTGEIIVFLSGHSLPITSKWLGSLVSSISDRDVAGVCGAQKPIPQSNWIESLYRHVWYRSETIGSIFRHFNLANAALRRYYWELHPFNEYLEGCEDRHWSRLIRRRYGATFKFNPEALVFHSHIDSIPKTIRYLIWLFGTYMKSIQLTERPTK